jgi:type II secretory pathway pseudopilin PulG
MDAVFKKQNPRAGMTIIEIVVVIFILILVVYGVATVYGQFLDRQQLNAAVEGTVSIIQKAREQTLASKDSSFYGVHFDKVSEQVTLFKANRFSDAAKQQDVFQFPSSIEIQSTSTSSPQQIAGGDILFLRLTGDLVVGNGAALPAVGTSTLSGGSIIIRSKRSGAAKTINLSSTGIMQAQ